MTADLHYCATDPCSYFDRDLRELSGDPRPPWPHPDENCPSCGHRDGCQCLCCGPDTICDHPLPSVDTFRQVCQDCGEPVSDELADAACERRFKRHYGVRR